MAKFNADILTRLSEATPEDLRGALAAIREDVTTYAGQPASQANVDALSELRTAATAISGELTTRANLANDQAAALASLNADLDAALADGDQQDGDGQDDQGGDQDDSGTDAGDGAATTDADQGDAGAAD